MSHLRDPDFRGDLTLEYEGDLMLDKVQVFGEVIVDGAVRAAGGLHTRPGLLHKEGPSIALQGRPVVVTGSRGSGVS